MAEGVTHYDRDEVVLHEGDMREVLAGMEEETFTACVTDPPYHLTSAPGSKGGFMGKTWDGSGIAFDPDTWRTILCVLKPGGMLLAFGGTRTFHRMACAVEDAGFVLRDMMMWMYGSGFPKGYDISKGIDKKLGAKRKKVKGGIGSKTGATYSKEGGYVADEQYADEPATPEAALWHGMNVALKPAYEPILIAMKPTDGGFADNALKHGVAGLNVDGGRIEGTPRSTGTVNPHAESGVHGVYGRDSRTDRQQRYDANKPAGRWPANVILSHDERCVCVGTRRVNTGTAFANTDGKCTKSYSGGLRNRQHANEGYAGADGHEEVELYACVPGCPVRMLDEQSGTRPGSHSQKPTDVGHKSAFGGGRNLGVGFGDTGTASRFFYTAKASTAERNLGLSQAERNLHPTVKPIDLMRYLLTLVTMPKDTRILDPFAGSGSTLIAAKQLGLECVGIELEKESCEVAAARLSRRTTKGIGKPRKLKRRKRT